MIAAQILTHVADAQARLLQQFRSKPLIAGLAAAVVAPIQSFENAFFSIDSGRQLGTAVGAQLDGIGTLLGTPRSGLSDDQYRALLYGTLAEDNSDTTLPTLTNIIQSVFGAVAVFVDAQLPGGNVGFGIGSPSVTPALFPMLEGIVLKSVAAGMQVSFMVVFNAYNAFAMAGPQSWVGGFGDANDPTQGGLLADLIYNSIGPPPPPPHGPLYRFTAHTQPTPGQTVILGGFVFTARAISMGGYDFGILGTLDGTVGNLYGALVAVGIVGSGEPFPSINYNSGDVFFDASWYLGGAYSLGGTWAANTVT